MSGEIEINTLLARRFLGIEADEFIELTAFVEGRIHVAQCASESDHIRLLADAERIRGFNGAYMLANGPVDPALGARYEASKWHRGWNGRATDRDIRKLRALFIDCDPVRPKGISATDAEQRAAGLVAGAVVDWFAAELGSRGAVAQGCSGNGFFVLVALEPIEPSPETTQHVSKTLELLGRKFSTDLVKIDRSVANPARLVPAPGTWKRKGTNTPERPHRMATFACAADVERVPLSRLVAIGERLAAELGPDKSAVKPVRVTGPRAVAQSGAENLFTRANAVATAFVLDQLGIEHHDSNRGEMAVCPGCGEEGALVCSGGGIKCLHNRCADAGPRNNPGFRTNVDLVAHAQNVEPSEAARVVLGWVGVDVPRISSGGRPDDDYVPEPPEWLDAESDSGGEQAAADVPASNAPADKPSDAAKVATKPAKSAIEQYSVVDLRALCDEVVKVAKEGRPQRGYTTGNHEIDIAINGLRHEHVTLFAAGTSYGKSSLGIMIADENLRVGVPVLVVSVEDSKVMYGKRLMARRASVNALRLRNNSCDREELERLERAAASAQSVPFFMSGIGKSVEWCADGIRAMCSKYGTRLVICDYVQRFTTAKHQQDRRNQVTHVASVLSDAIKESGASGLLLSQLKRIEGREPIMDDVKESGDLENMAEHVMLGWREKGGKPYYSGEEPPQKRFIKIPKNKDGPTIDERIELPFNAVTASFDSIRPQRSDYTDQNGFRGIQN